MLVLERAALRPVPKPPTLNGGRGSFGNRSWPGLLVWKPLCRCRRLHSTSAPSPARSASRNCTPHTDTIPWLSPPSWLVRCLSVAWQLLSVYDPDDTIPWLSPPSWLVRCLSVAWQLLSVYDPDDTIPWLSPPLWLVRYYSVAWQPCQFATRMMKLWCRSRNDRCAIVSICNFSFSFLLSRNTLIGPGEEGAGLLEKWLPL